MKKSGEIFKPGQQPTAREAQQPKIMGAPPITEKPPKTLDSRSTTEPTPVETTTHGEAVTVRGHVRSKPQRKDEPEVRVRQMSKEERAAWESARRAET